MQIRRIDPWSTLKVSLLLSVALFFVWMIAVAFLYLVLGGMGVWAKLNSNVGDLLNNTSGSSGELVSSGTIFGGAVLIGLVNIVLDDRDGHHRGVRLQPDDRSDRRYRSDVGGPGLVGWVATRCARLRRACDRHDVLGVGRPVAVISSLGRTGVRAYSSGG